MTRTLLPYTTLHLLKLTPTTQHHRVMSREEEKGKFNPPET